MSANMCGQSQRRLLPRGLGEREGAEAHPDDAKGVCAQHFSRK